uniref:Uncharacterized protein LOC114336811 n=2 Tax=Diabrotica virgifera virgifera TaxID=50390 RepID=A0A6P7G268_DIAVI
MEEEVPPDPPPPPDPPNKINQHECQSQPPIIQKSLKGKKQILFSETDIGPYEVFVQGQDKNIGDYHVLSIAKSISVLKIKDITKISRKGKNRIGVLFATRKAANDFVVRKDWEALGYDVFIPFHQISCRGIVRGVNKRFTEEEIKEASETNLALCKILSVKRMNRRVQVDSKVEFVSTGTISITFSGKTIPKEISIYQLPMRVTPFISPVLQCGNCLLYGHSTNQSRGKKKCARCGTSHEDSSSNTCTKYYIFSKSSDHESSSRNCRERESDKKILRI